MDETEKKAVDEEKSLSYKRLTWLIAFASVAVAGLIIAEILMAIL